MNNVCKAKRKKLALAKNSFTLIRFLSNKAAVMLTAEMIPKTMPTMWM